jgi:hypothetical protein
MSSGQKQFAGNLERRSFRGLKASPAFSRGASRALAAAHNWIVRPEIESAAWIFLDLPGRTHVRDDLNVCAPAGTARIRRRWLAHFTRWVVDDKVGGRKSPFAIARLDKEMRQLGP